MIPVSGRQMAVQNHRRPSESVDEVTLQVVLCAVGVVSAPDQLHRLHTSPSGGIRRQNMHKCN